MDTKLTSPFLLLQRALQIGFSKKYRSVYLSLGTLNIAAFLLLNYSASFQSWVTPIFYLTNALASCWLVGISAFLNQDAERGTLIDISHYGLKAKKRVISVFITFVKMLVLIFFGLMLFIVPGFIVMVRLGFASIIAVLDPMANPLKESGKLVKGRFWPLVSRLLVYIGVFNIPFIALSRIHIMLGYSWSIVTPLASLYFYLVYLDFKKTTPIFQTSKVMK